MKKISAVNEYQEGGEESTQQQQQKIHEKYINYVHVYVFYSRPHLKLTLMHHKCVSPNVCICVKFLVPIIVRVVVDDEKSRAFSLRFTFFCVQRRRCVHSDLSSINDSDFFFLFFLWRATM